MLLAVLFPVLNESPIENVKVDNTIGSLMDDPTCSLRLDVHIERPITIESESYRSHSASERDAILEQLQREMKIFIPPNKSLAIKADLTLPLSKLRIIRRYISTAHYSLRLHTHVLHVAGGSRCGGVGSVGGEDEKGSIKSRW